MPVTNTKPNILFIFADDWGYGDLGCYGHEELQTSNLDRLADQGTRYTQFHVTSPVCSPSRCSVITGHYPARHLVHGHFARYDLNERRHMPNWLETDVYTLPRLLQQAGYRTAHYGKWHLGGGGGIHGHPEAPPVKAYGYDDTRTWNGNGPTWYGTDPWPFALHNDVDAVWAANSGRLAVDATIEFIKQASEQPFFVNLWLKDPHTPLHPTEKQRAPYQHLPEPKQTYYSVISNADKQVGRLLEALDVLGVADNTLVIFSSDNGPEVISNDLGTYGSTGGLRGRKRSLYEGGVRTPFIVRWPGRTLAGRVDSDSLISAVDLLPTFLSIAGVPVPRDLQPDGADITAALTNNSLVRPVPLMWEWRFFRPEAADFWPMLAIRDEELALITNPVLGKLALYNVKQDAAQTQNLAERYPAEVKRLHDQLEDWNRALPGYATRPQ